MLQVEDAVAELQHAATIGLHVVSLPTGNPPGTRPYNDKSWDPLWAAAEQANMVLGFHIGTDGGDQAVAHRGAGVRFSTRRNDVWRPARRYATRYQRGARSDERGLSPTRRVCSSTVEQTSERNLVPPGLRIVPARRVGSLRDVGDGYQNVMFGSDYPHLEGTFGHTQKTLHELFDDLAEPVRNRITVGAFRELFPHTSLPPADL